MYDYIFVTYPLIDVNNNNLCDSITLQAIAVTRVLSSI